MMMPVVIVLILGSVMPALKFRIVEAVYSNLSATRFLLCLRTRGARITSRMSIGDGDISWETLRCIVHEWIGTAAEPAEIKTLHGGFINTTVKLTTTTGERAVLKLSAHRADRSYLQEAFQLNVLRTVGLPVPQVFGCKVGTLDEPFSYLLMEFLPGIDLNRARSTCDGDQFNHLQMHLADLITALHSQVNASYTRLTEADRVEWDNWAMFYRSMYDPICREVGKLIGLPVKARKTILKIHDNLERLIVHDDRPRLSHCDLWASNILVKPDGHGRWWISGLLDPNCKYAHAEMELAYLELFQTVTPAFMRAYQVTHRIPAEYQRFRKSIYQMYALMDAVLLHGAEHLKPLLAAVQRAGTSQ